MDRARPDLPAPISLESHALPPAAKGDVARRRGQGYLRSATAADAQPAAVAVAPNRADRRARLRAVRRGHLAPVAALLLGPASVLLAGPAAAAPGDPTTTTSMTSTVGPTTTAAPTSTTGATTTSAAPTTTGAPTSTTTTTTTTAGRVTTTAPTTTTSTAAPVPTATTATTATTADRSGGTLPATVVPGPAESTTTTSTVPGATEPLPVGAPELPPETPADADPVAAGASGALRLHRDVVTATKELARLADEHGGLDRDVQRLEGRVAELTTLAFDLAHDKRPTAEVELTRSDAQADLDAARGRRAATALREAVAGTALDEASTRYPIARRQLAGLVTARAGGDVGRLDAAWAGAADERLDVVYAALAQVGDPYVWATSGPDTFDCSGLTGFAWKAAGIDLTHYTVTQRQESFDVLETDLRTGDLVFNDLDGPNGGHVMLFLGLGHLVVQASAPGTLVSVSEWRTVTGFGSPLLDARTVGTAETATAG